jgi:hypothetical protein
MCRHHQSSLDHIYENWINNDNVHQNTEVVFNNKNIHSSLDVAKEQVGDLPSNMCSILQSNSYNNILKCIVGCCTFTLVGTPKQMGT